MTQKTKNKMVSKKKKKSKNPKPPYQQDFDRFLNSKLQQEKSELEQKRNMLSSDNSTNDYYYRTDDGGTISSYRSAKMPGQISRGVN